jgi:hypothetical protein
VRCNERAANQAAAPIVQPRFTSSYAALAHHPDVAKALPPLVSHLTPSRRKAFVPKFLSILIESFRFGRRCYFAFRFSVNADFYERTA